MKYGVRKPSLSKSVKARTTGQIKRSVKGSLNPLYGKKGMGLIKDPKRAVYNKIYRKTTVDALEPMKSNLAHTAKDKPSSMERDAPKKKSRTTLWVVVSVCSFIAAVLLFGEMLWGVALLFVLAGFVLMLVALTRNL